MARSALQKSIDQRQAKLDREMARLANDNRSRVVERPSCATIGRDIARLYPEAVVRTVDSLPREPKTKDERRIRVAMARHIYGRYPVPGFLNDLWLNPKLEVGYAPGFRITTEWMVCAAGGRSLWKEFTKDFLTKKETHAFLTCRDDITVVQGLVYAMAKSYTDDIGRIHRLYASQKVCRLPLNAPETREIIRYFAANSCSLHAMEDLIDYIQYAFRNNPQYSLKGRTIEALKINAEAWHRELQRHKALDGAVWRSCGMPLWTYRDGEEHNHQTVEWMMMEITTGNDLAAEGTRMRHCVLSYKSLCQSGQCVIFSLRRRDISTGGEWRRALTIEVRGDRIAQVRGVANRLANSAERSVVSRWARENDLQYTAY